MRRLEQLRVDRGLALRDLARETGVPFSTIGNIERGESDGRVGTLTKLADFFGVPASTLTMDALPPRDEAAA